MTTDSDWAAESFTFRWGESSLEERLRAAEDLMGSQAEMIRLAGIEGAAYKMALKRGSSHPVERIGAIAGATGLTLDYLVWGKAVSARDGECEEKRFDLAAKEFDIPSSMGRREARRLLIAQRRAELEDCLAQLGGTQFRDRPAPSSPLPPPPGYALLAPLHPTVHFSGKGYYATAEPAPIAVAPAWLEERGLSPQGLAYLHISGDEGGAGRPSGTIVLVDASDRQARSGVVFAMDIGGEAQLRRIVHRKDGAVELQHVNQEWPPERLSAPDEASILGREVAYFRPS